MKTPILDHGYLEMVTSWGSDEDIIRAARMSTNKGFQGWESDTKLLRYLWEHKHHTPFEMAGLTVEAQLPIFVAREWVRHRTQSFNELSARYAELPNLFYIPSIERLMAGVQSKKNRQGSEFGFTKSEALSFQWAIRYNTNSARERYEQLLDLGLSRELARLVIPVNQYTRWRASANLRNWLHFLGLRMASNSQWEIRQYANAIGDLVKTQFPRTHELFVEGMA